jgi:hypothetical protein
MMGAVFVGARHVHHLIFFESASPPSYLCMEAPLSLGNGRDSFWPMYVYLGVEV